MAGIEKVTTKTGQRRYRVRWRLDGRARRGGRRRPPRPGLHLRVEERRPSADDGGYDAALAERDDRHAQPLPAVTPPFGLRHQAAELRRGLASLVAERPAAALAATEELQRWADALAARARGVLQGPARSRPRLGR